MNRHATEWAAEDGIKPDQIKIESVAVLRGVAFEISAIEALQSGVQKEDFAATAGAYYDIIKKIHGSTIPLQAISRGPSKH